MELTAGTKMNCVALLTGFTVEHLPVREIGERTFDSNGSKLLMLLMRTSRNQLSGQLEWENSGGARANRRGGRAKRFQRKSEHK